MPQITCPKCGMTINLENRKEIDVNLIKGATKKNPMTFTDLLNTTKLPRKTLSLRLKELCLDGTIVKNNGLYMLNGIMGFRSENNMKSQPMRFSRARVLTLIALLLFSTTSGYVLATLIAPQQKEAPYEEPTVIGNFTMALSVENVVDLFAWEVAITYNESELKVLNIESGEFLGVSYPLLPGYTDVYENTLNIGQFLLGDSLGRSGSGTLVRVVFGYFDEHYQKPSIDFQGPYPPRWFDSKGNTALFDEYSLTLAAVT